MNHLVVYEEAESVKLDEQIQNQLMADACQEKIRFHRLTQGFRDKAMEVRQLYLDTMPEGLVYDSEEAADDTTASIKRPVMAEATDSIHAQLMQSTYPSDERFFKGKAKNKIAKEKMAQYEAHIEARLSEINFIIKTTQDWINALLDGVSTVACPFVRQEKEKAVYKPIFEAFGIKLGRRKTYETVISFEGTDFVPLMLQDTWFDPTVDDFNKTPFIWRQWMKKEELQAIKIFKNTANLKPCKESFDEDDSDRRLNYEFMGITYDYTVDMENAIDAALARDNVLVYERWGDFYIKGKLYENHVLVWANDRVFLHFGPNEYDHGLKPFALSPYIPLPGTLLGKSLGRDIVPLCHALNTLLNMAFDILNANSDPTYTAKITDDTLWDCLGEGKIPVGNGKYIWVKDHDSLKPITKDLRGLEIISQFMESIKEEIREMTGGVPYATGAVTNEGAEKTLGEVNILASGTSTRIQARIQNYETFKLKPFLSMSVENDRQFMTEDVMVDGFDEPLTEEDVKDMDLVMEVTGSKSIMTRQKAQQEFTDFALNVIPAGIEAGFLIVKGEKYELDGYAMFKEIGRMRNINLDDFADKVEMPQAAPGMDPAAAQGGLGGLQLIQNPAAIGAGPDLARIA